MVDTGYYPDPNLIPEDKLFLLNARSHFVSIHKAPVKCSTCNSLVVGLLPGEYAINGHSTAERGGHVVAACMKAIRSNNAQL